MTVFSEHGRAVARMKFIAVETSPTAWAGIGQIRF